jgi:hypothetical protein
MIYDAYNFKISMEHFWKDNDKPKQNYSKEHMAQSHSVHQKSHAYCSRIE